MRPLMPEELLNKWAVLMSIILIFIGIIGIITCSPNSDPQESITSQAINRPASSASQTANSSEGGEKIGFALISLGGGALFSQIILIDIQRKRREYIYRSLIRCLCRISISILYAIIENGIISIKNNNYNESKVSLIIREFEDHLINAGYALPASGCLIDVIQDNLQPAIYNGDFDMGAFKRFIEMSNNDLQYLLGRLLPAAYELSEDTEIKDFFEITESKCNILISKLSHEEWDNYPRVSSDTQPSFAWTNYRSYILNEGEETQTSDGLLNANIHDFLSVGYSYVAFRAIEQFSFSSALIIKIISESLSLGPGKVNDRIDNP